MSEKIFNRIAQELNIRPIQVSQSVTLLDEGATVPFIARYRKEATGELDDQQLRVLDERLRYLRELEDRKVSILANIDEQGKLTAELTVAINGADNKTDLEDLYLPYKQKRRTKGQIATEAGLLPLADSLLEDPSQDPQQLAQSFIDKDKGIEDTKAALDGAKYILMERFAESAPLIKNLRQFLTAQAKVKTAVIPGKEAEGEKFQDYFEYDEALKNIPSHRALAIFRGRNEGIIQFNLTIDDSDARESGACEQYICEEFNLNLQDRPADKWLGEVVRWTWRVKLLSHLETDLMSNLREKSEVDAINVFAKNLSDLLLAAPAGPRPTLGLDPGFRSGVKVAIVDGTGKILDHGAIYPHQPQNKWDQSVEVLALLCKKHNVELIAIGNGTASRETDTLAAELIKKHSSLKLTKIVVSEAGASVYSASEFAAREFPDLDVTIRGAISIARRLQDPLAELVKIDPKAIGVGQYQHDVSQVALARSLDAVVEDCVNGVGVDLNTASEPLLSRVSGLTSSTAKQIVAYRQSIGGFTSRKQLLDVPRLGPKAFEQAAGFLRINGGENPLDNSSVHPEAYPVVNNILAKTNQSVASVLGDTSFLRSVNAQDFADENIGVITVKDILKELEKPGRDPRPEFKTATFQDGVEKISDLKPGMKLEGVITNVTNFGAFVDVGVHQDGLVHISALSYEFIEDPSKVVKAGQIVKVKVMEVEVDRKRIALSMRLDDEIQAGDKKQSQKRSQPKMPKQPDMPNNTMAGLFAQAKQKQNKRK